MAVKKRRIAYLGNLFHQRTRSMEFFVELLQERHEVDFYWGLPKNQCREIDLHAIRERGYDGLVCWQVMLPPRELARAVPPRNVIMVPMWDMAHRFTDRAWRKYDGFRFVSFCGALHRRLESLRIRSWRVQYYPQPVPDPPAGEERPRVFFWQRRDEITWDLLRILLQGNPTSEVVLHKAVDPHGTYVAPTAKDRSTYSIRETDWFPSQQDYWNQLAGTDVFVAPRIREGIGLSFLEAMAMGKCVVAADAPTMNEYIEHGVTGLLFDPENPQPLDLSNHRAIGAAARASVEQGRGRWLQQARELAALDFRRSPMWSLLGRLGRARKAHG